MQCNALSAPWTDGALIDRLSLPTAKVLQGRSARFFLKIFFYTFGCVFAFCILVFVNSQRDLLQSGKQRLHL